MLFFFQSNAYNGWIILPPKIRSFLFINLLISFSVKTQKYENKKAILFISSVQNRTAPFLCTVNLDIINQPFSFVHTLDYHI
jgi:hypothetical protein